jgi:pre-mRNA-splicing factor ATP-dependent RNA helicase DHX15/PRP43
MASTDNNIGILDPLGKNPNPFTNEPYSDNYKKLAQDWSKLPAYKHIHEILKVINDNQVSLFCFQTGVGKTSVIPRAVLHHFDYKENIIMSLPKQIVTKSGATYASAMLDIPLGTFVGYKYKNSPPESHSDMTKLLFATDGTVVAKLLNNQLLSDYKCLIIDELHEQKIQIDMLLYLVRELLHKRPDFKLVLMSATIDVSIFKKYFKDFKFASMGLDAEKHHHIDTIFSKSTLDYDSALKECFNILIHILETDDPKSKKHSHDIIIFVSSSNDAFKLCKQLSEYQENEKKTKCNITCSGDVYCVEVYSGMDHKKEELATNKDLYKLQGNYNRKVAICTNVAESSITIDGLRYVINVPYEFKGSFDPVNSARKLDRELISIAQARQRCGRVGRTEPGTCYHLCSEQDYHHTMIKYPLPDIQISDITMESLQLLATPLISDTKQLLKVFSNFVSPPKEPYIKYTLNILLQINAIENETLTPLGKMLANIPCNNIFMSLAILYGKIYNCSRELLQIASLIEVSKGNINDLFNSPNPRDYSKEGQSKMAKFEKAKKKMANKYGDFLTLLYIYDKYTTKDESKEVNKFCYDNFLKCKSLEKAKKNYKNSKRQLHISEHDINNLHIKMFPDVLQMELQDRILFCLMAGFKLNVAVNKRGSDYYRASMSNLDNIKLHKSSFLNYVKSPPNVIYYELFLSMGKAELSTVGVIPDHIVKKLNL